MKITQRKFLLSIPKSKITEKYVLIGHHNLKELIDIPQALKNFIDKCLVKNNGLHAYSVERDTHLGPICFKNITSLTEPFSSSYLRPCCPKIILTTGFGRDLDETVGTVEFGSQPTLGNNLTLLEACQSLSNVVTKLVVKQSISPCQDCETLFEYYKNSYSEGDEYLCLILTMRASRYLSSEYRPVEYDLFIQAVEKFIKEIPDAEILEVTNDPDFSDQSLATSLEPIMSKVKSTPISSTQVSL